MERDLELLVGVGELDRALLNAGLEADPRLVLAPRRDDAERDRHGHRHQLGEEEEAVELPELQDVVDGEQQHRPQRPGEEETLSPLLGLLQGDAPPHRPPDDHRGEKDRGCDHGQERPVADGVVGDPGSIGADLQRRREEVGRREAADDEPEEHQAQRPHQHADARLAGDEPHHRDERIEEQAQREEQDADADERGRRVEVRLLIEARPGEEERRQGPERRPASGFVGPIREPEQAVVQRQVRRDAERRQQQQVDEERCSGGRHRPRVLREVGTSIEGKVPPWICSPPAI